MDNTKENNSLENLEVKKHKERKVFIVGGNNDYANWLIPIGFSITKNINECDLIFFTGGEDVSPQIYGEQNGQYTHFNERRDDKELQIFEDHPNKNKLGVCRGGQFLTVANGYKLVQHSSHPSWHNISTYDGQTLLASSTHHQQFLLNPNRNYRAREFDLIGWAENLSGIHLNGKNKDYYFDIDYKEPEIVLFYNDGNNSKSLAIQMHVEFFDLDHPTVKYMQNLIINTLFTD